jgi:prepilin-type N-terminal cleavage/methylation domain-containing protein
MRTNRGGWTLVEVLVVVAILLVLAGLIYAVGAYALDRARQTQCISNLRQIGIALQQYMDDYKQADWETEIDSYPGIEDLQERRRLVARWGFPRNLYQLYEAGYLKDKRLLQCSASRYAGDVHYGYDDLSLLIRMPPHRQGQVNTWEDDIWVLQQRKHDFPIRTPT